MNIYLSSTESAAVRIAAKNLCKDIAEVCGANAALTEDARAAKIAIRTEGRENSDFLDKDGGLIWEAYSVRESGGTLCISGADRRGTVYGIYDFCEYIGVSPWYWFADVPIRQRDRIEMQVGYKRVDHPTVQYRGIFINDEEELEAWAKAHTGEDTIGPKTYERVFELLLRLKANYIWPAMHVNAFNADPENGRLANEMGIVVGTSHCDMLLRSNQNEWTPWRERNGCPNTEYDYSIEGENRETIKRYWRGSVEQNKDYEVCYTVGMRGIHDSGFVTREIDRADISDSERKARKIKLLENVVADQREIISEVTGRTDAAQTFIPYKEVLELYDGGLSLPDDITLIWANDNFGYMRRYPGEAERARSGGNGLYYHASYWASPGMSYLFINSTPLAQTKNELRKSYENGIRKMWVLNVGAIKPLEQDIEFFLRYAWEIDGGEKTTADVTKFTAAWIDRNFSGDHGKDAAEIYNTYAQITNVRKVEHMKSNVFSQTAFGNEAARRMRKYEDIYRRTASIHRSLPENERDAFFQMFAMKIYAAYFINASFYYADRSALMYERGQMRAADECTALSRRADNYKRRLICYYNTIMSGGKWDRILTPEEFPPPCMALYPACKPALVINGSDASDTESAELPPLYKSESGYAENDGYISVAAEHYSENTGWRQIEHLGRFEGSVMEANGGTLEYELNFTSSGRFTLELYRFPTLDSTGRIRFGISVDGGEISVVESPSNDEWRGSWKENVMDNVEKLRLMLPKITAGKHTLKVHAIDKYAAFSKLAVYTNGFVKSSLGPPESFHARFNPSPERGRFEYELDTEFADQLFSDMFRKTEAPLPDVIYADREFWGKDRLFLRNTVRAQRTLGARKYASDSEGRKNTFEKLRSGVFVERNGAIAFGSEYALLNCANAYMIPDKIGAAWEHTQAETDGGTGLAMHIAKEGLAWNDPLDAPSLNYKISAGGGEYDIWLLLKYDDPASAGCYIGIDGAFIPQEDMCGGGKLFNYGTKQNWVWMLAADARISAGEHIFTIAAKASGLRIDRIYLTKGAEYPPTDAEWDDE